MNERDELVENLSAEIDRMLSESKDELVLNMLREIKTWAAASDTSQDKKAFLKCLRDEADRQISGNENNENMLEAHQNILEWAKSEM